eukprot:CAMPEP_0198504686 /NCGR_PEP_ID=MMETSP1462-20131121/10622_1 /TAXON_ID=1333877 /ORGANISM="Brandtodinium nutriculum, Strain RCC3387" /LENGTH=340 /DNA_ID=CAMNT_0044233859 /DNA_START=80 /DNA_END=1102 /DNA_ORIENTATION=-
MSTSLVVKNTFICALDAEALSPVRGVCRRRSSSDSLGSTTCGSFGQSDDDSWEGTTASGDDGAGASAFAEELEAGGAGAAAACAALAFDPLGSCWLLRAMELGGVGAAKVVSTAMAGGVCKAARSAHACAVLESLICMLSTDEVSFIASEMCAAAMQIATHVHGHAVVCRLLEYSGGAAPTLALADAVLAEDAAVLCCHKFGHHVAMSLLSNGLTRHRRAIVTALFGRLPRFARHRFASSVVVQALSQCADEEGGVLAAQLVATPVEIVGLAVHNFGVAVVRALLDMPAFRPHVMVVLAKASKRMMKDKFGRGIMMELAGIGRAFVEADDAGVYAPGILA